MKATEQYFPVALFIMLYKVFQSNFWAWGWNLKHDHSNDNYWAVLSCGFDLDETYLHEQNTLSILDISQELHQISCNRLPVLFHLAYLQNYNNWNNWKLISLPTMTKIIIYFLSCIEQWYWCSTDANCLKNKNKQSNKQTKNLPCNLPTSQGNQYLDILPVNSISQGWTKIAHPNSSAA